MRPKVGLGFKYISNEDITSLNNISRNEKVEEYTSRLELVTNGWIYDPAFFNFNIFLAPEFTNWEYSDTTMSSSEDAYLSEYSFTASILDLLPLSFHLYGLRSEDAYWYAYSGKTDLPRNR